jgi:hypothetical protein
VDVDARLWAPRGPHADARRVVILRGVSARQCKDFLPAVDSANRPWPTWRHSAAGFTARWIPPEPIAALAPRQTATAGRATSPYWFPSVLVPAATRRLRKARHLRYAKSHDRQESPSPPAPTIGIVAADCFQLAGLLCSLFESLFAL